MHPGSAGCRLARGRVKPPSVLYTAVPDTRLVPWYVANYTWYYLLVLLNYYKT